MAKSYIQIEGIFEREVLGSFDIIRGFATLQDLAEISVPVLMEAPDAAGRVHGYQRQLDEQHADEVKRYFEKGDQRFIPEIILSLRVRLEPDANGGVRYNGGGGLDVRRKHSSKNIHIHTLKVLKKNLECIRSEKLIRRIDGNHRLEKANDLPPIPGQVNRYKVPFCLLLLEDLGNRENDYTEALIFHTINSTAKPLDGEQAIQLILGQPLTLSMPAHKEFEYSPALHFTRLLSEKIMSLPCHIKNWLGERRLARLSVAARELLHSYPECATSIEAMDQFAREIRDALDNSCAHIHDEFPDFCRADYFIELVSHVWMRAKDQRDHDTRLRRCCDYLFDVARWMGSDGLRGLSTDKPLGRQLIEIYDAVRERIPKKVFLARWYPRDEDGVQKTRANNRLTALKNLVEDHFGLELIDMGTQEGGTYSIQEQMYDSIESSDIIIADLTGLRPNVMIELGYALHHHREKRLLLIFNSITGAERIPFDTQNFLYIPIDEAADIPRLLTGHLQQIIQRAREGRI